MCSESVPRCLILLRTDTRMQAQEELDESFQLVVKRAVAPFNEDTTPEMRRLTPGETCIGRNQCILHHVYHVLCASNGNDYRRNGRNMLCMKGVSCSERYRSNETEMVCSEPVRMPCAYTPLCRMISL